MAYLKKTIFDNSDLSKADFFCSDLTQAHL
ncbi:MAG: pentapeptide repeat-containing protein [Nitrososphaeraceae archaeon]